MGKLHSLRRAVQREPEKFLAPETFYTNNKRLSLGASRKKTGWKPERRTKYNKFIKKVLESLGYNVWTW